ncbi:MAG: glycosyltransferase, partial [Spirochaetia bacterium]|nr:glycosyltransferase [Spirochaetia bacterium]
MALKFSIVIPVKDLNHYLKESIPVLLALPEKNFDIFLLPDEYGGAAKNKPVQPRLYAKDPFFSSMSGFKKHGSRLRLIPTGSTGPASKRDMAAKLSRADVLAFLDDDAYPDRHWLGVANRYFSRGEDALGGPAVTPPRVSALEEASGLVFETFLGGGLYRFRYRSVGKSFLVDDFPTVNLLVRRKAFLKVGGFDTRYWPGEDTKFCLDFTRAGYTIRYVPELVVWHHRRPLFGSHLRQISAYARHRGFFAKRFPKTSLRLSYFMPTFFLAGLLAGWIPGFFFEEVLWLYGGVVLVYFLVNAVNGWVLAKGGSFSRRLLLTM